jgi:hypothetical protein
MRPDPSIMSCPFRRIASSVSRVASITRAESPAVTSQTPIAGGGGEFGHSIVSTAEATTGIEHATRIPVADLR